MPRFVLLRHDVPHDFGKRSHWDLMLEREPNSLEDPTNESSDSHRLATWNLFELPMVWNQLLLKADLKGADFPIEAVLLDDHRVHYLDYQGPVSNNRGEVSRVAEGEICWITAGPRQYEVQLLQPAKLAGRLILEQPTQSSNDQSRWLLRWNP